MPFLFVALAALIIGFLLRRFFFIGARWPATQKPDPKPQVGCNYSDITTRQFYATADFTTDKDITAAAGDTITGKTVTVSGLLNPTSSLTIVAEKDLTVSGKIFGRGTPGANINLISLQGKVTIGRLASIQLGALSDAPAETATGDADTNPSATARAAAGTNAGYIRIVGVNVEIAGEVFGGDGGEGGAATAEGKGTRVVAGVLQPVRGRAATAIAVAGSGGFGGDVIICARDSVGVLATARVEGGNGGAGGAAEAKTENASEAYARGGDGGDGGNLLVTPSGTGGTLQVFIEQGATLAAGNDSSEFAKGGDASARGGFAFDNGPRLDGGNAEALAGNGGAGAMVLLTNCLVTNNGGTIRSGNGHKGGKAVASAGAGADAAGVRKNGRRGGNAKAKGGDGGKDGRSPRYLTRIDPPGQPSGLVELGKDGMGGNADATPGPGGTGAAGGVNGPAGSSKAQGGSNGRGDPAVIKQFPPGNFNAAHSDGVPPQ